MGKANFYYSARDGKWILAGKGGSIILEVLDTGQVIHKSTSKFDGVVTLGQGLNVGSLARLQQLNVASGTNINFIRGLIGTSLALTSVGTNTKTIGTIAATGLAVGDKVFMTPRTTLDTIIVANPYVPTTNVLNFYAFNPDIVAEGSLAATQFDILAVRTG